MTKPTRVVTPDEKARAAANRLQIATGWYPTTASGRITIRLTPDDVDQLLERLHNSDQWETEGGDAA